MLEQTLKDLAERGFDIMWHYDIPMNAIHFRLSKQKENGYRRTLCRMVDFEEFRLNFGNEPLFEFHMCRILNEMAQQIEMDIQLEKGNQRRVQLIESVCKKRDDHRRYLDGED